jgi:O6-methylguanine-DNA--protein-cysteine methyltransferase
MNEAFADRDAERPIATLREQTVLEDGVLDAVTDSFFGVESPLGTVYVAAGPGGARYLAPATSEGEFARRYPERFGRFVSPANGLADLAERVATALGGERVEVPLDLSRATPFQRRILETVKGIARAIGNVMANNPVLLLVPCHRVVRNDGRTGSYTFGVGEKVRLLRLEGVSPEEISGSPYVATPTTGVVCHATCRNARRIRPENRCTFHSAKEPTDVGYRPCEVCRPVAAA